MGDKYYSKPEVHYSGYAVVVPENSSGNSKASYSQIAPNQSNNYQYTTKNSIVDKQSGSYVKTSMKESSSTGDVFKERSTGRLGYKDEYKTTQSFKVGDKSGYSEYQVEERYRRVNYDTSGSSGYRGKGSYYNKKYLK